MIDTLITGQIYTLDQIVEPVESLGIRNGKIVYVGSLEKAEKLCKSDTKKIDFNNKVILPGFVDAHIHLTTLGLSFTRLDLTESKSISALLEKLRDYSKKNPSKILIGFGWDDSQLKERRFPVNEELDSAVNDRPVILIRVCGHAAVLNSRAIEYFSRILKHNILQIEELHGKISDIELETVLSVIKPKFKEYYNGLLKAQEYILSKGIVAIGEFGDIHTYSVYEKLAHRLKVYVRHYFQIFSFNEFFTLYRFICKSPLVVNKKLYIGGIKIYMDGSIGARTASLSEPYSDSQNEYGTVFYTTEQLKLIFRKCQRRGIQLVIHAIGDRAIYQTLNILKLMRTDNPFHHRIEHYELPDEKSLALTQKKNIYVCMQPNFIGNWSGPGALYETRLGKTRVKENNPLRKILDRGIRLSFSSDNRPVSPLYGIHWAVNGYFTEQRIDVLSAIRCYTRNAAEALYFDHFLGTLSVNKSASFVVLSEDPLKNREQLNKIKITATFIDGKKI